MSPGERRFLATLVAATLALLAVGFLQGCGRQPCVDQRAGECLAGDVVWVDTYGASDLPRPHVIWECDPRCPGYPQACGFWSWWGDGCIGGTYFAVSNTAYVNNYPEIWSTTFSHELLHALLNFRYGFSDRWHQRPEWSILVPLANQRLQDSGL